MSPDNDKVKFTSELINSWGNAVKPKESTTNFSGVFHISD